MQADIEFAPVITTVMPFNQAWLYCLTLSYNGHKDWRLPTRNEYEQHIEYSEYRYSFDQSDVRNDIDETYRLRTCPVRTK